jgi:hypothetical protein
MPEGRGCWLVLRLVDEPPTKRQLEQKAKHHCHYSHYTV